MDYKKKIDISVQEYSRMKVKRIIRKIVYPERFLIKTGKTYFFYCLKDIMMQKTYLLPIKKY
jgi:hypothetical protein